MTKPLPTGCIKEKPSPTRKEFIISLEKASFEDQVGHLLVVDIEFYYKKANQKQFYYKEIFCPTFEKNTIIDANEKKICPLYPEQLKFLIVRGS